ncbi:Purine catabolism protein PucB [Baekduia alba]|uniref:nucleotidyltransferase family protein n=1 Tax=Baekduia alba TaxID=2997333 RepID=UPI00233FEBF9|nr:nucleotidyltransferase family protein [Baekduia alba]WCB94110.1 Purine catabolism protein PucB [Baekduia alba]
MADARVCGLVLAAGGSRRLGQPKHLLPFGERTLLDHSLATARACGFEQLLCAVGGAAQDVVAQVDLRDVEVVHNAAFGAGCSSSIAAALGAVRPSIDVLVLLLGDQPGVTTAMVDALLAGRGDAAYAVCRYDDGRGHPFAFSRSTFAALADLHGDKAVWKLLKRHADRVVEVPVAGPVPRDVDTWEDYEAVRR